MKWCCSKEHPYRVLSFQGNMHSCTVYFTNPLQPIKSIQSEYSCMLREFQTELLQVFYQK